MTISTDVLDGYTGRPAAGVPPALKGLTDDITAAG
jgi:5-hydroxyisourate hydrolase-like protein (transthyretin family)